MIKNKFDDNTMERYFEYNKDEGAFYWKTSPSIFSGIVAGQRAGTTSRWGRQRGPQIKALGKRVRVSAMVFKMETGNWPMSYLYHKDGNPNNCHISNLTTVNPAWGRGLTMKSSDSAYSLMFKDDEWFIRKDSEVLGPYVDMKDAQETMYRIILEES